MYWVFKRSITFDSVNPCVRVYSKEIINIFKKIFIFRGRGREGEGGRETSMCGCPLRAPSWGSGPQPRHVPWLGIEPVTLWFEGQLSIHWATSARVGNNQHYLCTRMYIDFNEEILGSNLIILIRLLSVVHPHDRVREPFRHTFLKKF